MRSWWTISLSASVPRHHRRQYRHFRGQKQKGILGGIGATLGIVFPSLVIITALAGVINSFSHLDWVQHAFSGIRACVCVLIFNATLKLLKGSVKDWPAA